MPPDRSAMLEANYASNAEAARKIPEAIAAHDAKSYPQIAAERPADVVAAGRAIAAVDDRNVFLDQKVTWGTYANNLGHVDFPGCFRCHDGSHETSDKHAINQDYSSCHELLAQDEESPEILKKLGVWDHIEAMKSR